ncbi:dihydropteroate synthase [Streptomyces thioluteus]|uniref:dihydropteroate synthase n=1 Tax=Streptomyces thioluteus TaxID=66431 RepID=UPI0031E71CA6
MVNDVSGGLADPAMIPVVAQARVPFVVMHWRGFSEDMNSRRGLLGRHRRGRRRAGRGDGWTRWSRAVSSPTGSSWHPGLGLREERAQHDLELVARLGRLRSELGLPLLVAASRKRFLGRVLAHEDGGPAAGPRAGRGHGRRHGARRRARGRVGGARARGGGARARGRGPRGARRRAATAGEEAVVSGAVLPPRDDPQDGRAGRAGQHGALRGGGAAATRRP